MEVIKLKQKPSINDNCMGSILVDIYLPVIKFPTKKTNTKTKNM